MNTMYTKLAEEGKVNEILGFMVNDFNSVDFKGCVDFFKNMSPEEASKKAKELKLKKKQLRKDLKKEETNAKIRNKKTNEMKAKELFEKAGFLRTDKTRLEHELTNKCNVGGKCPKCSSVMVLRKGKYGDFLGCSSFPKCKNTEKLNSQNGSSHLERKIYDLGIEISRLESEADLLIKRNVKMQFDSESKKNYENIKSEIESIQKEIIFYNNIAVGNESLIELKYKKRLHEEKKNELAPNIEVECSIDTKELEEELTLIKNINQQVHERLLCEYNFDKLKFILNQNNINLEMFYKGLPFSIGGILTFDKTANIQDVVDSVVFRWEQCTTEKEIESHKRFFNEIKMYGCE